jgi:hypothetical protein
MLNSVQQAEKRAVVPGNKPQQGCVIYCLQLEVTPVVGHDLLAVVVDVAEQFLVQFFPSGAL